MRRSARGFVIALVLGVFVGTAAVSAQTAADPVEEAIAKAQAAYAEGDEGAAIDWLQKAIHMLQERLAGKVERFFPEAPEGWVADAIEHETVALGVSGDESVRVVALKRTYRKSDGSARVTLQLTNSPVLTAPRRALVELMKNPAYRQALTAGGSARVELIEERPWIGWKKEQGGRAELIVFAGDFMVAIEAQAGGLEALEVIWNALDRKALAAYLLERSDREGK